MNDRLLDWAEEVGIYPGQLDKLRAANFGRLGSPGLRRFLADIWAWLGGSREWHSTTARYHAVSKS